MNKKVLVFYRLQIYRSRYQAEYQLHDSLKKELQDLGVTKIPSSEKIQKRIENLETEQTTTVQEKQELRKKQKMLDVIQKNFTALLDIPYAGNQNRSPQSTTTKETSNILRLGDDRYVQ